MRSSIVHEEKQWLQTFRNASERVQKLVAQASTAVSQEGRSCRPVRSAHETHEKS